MPVVGGAAVNQDFVTYQGDDVQPEFTVLDGSGLPIDISAVNNIVWVARRNLGSSVVVTKQKTLGQITFLTDGTDGKFLVAITKADTAALDGYYLHAAAVVDSANNLTTVTVGRMQVGQPPVWTYDATQLPTSRLYQVRRIMGDVLITDQQLSDPEVEYATSIYPDNYMAAAECCRQIAAQYARKVDTIQGEVRTMYSSQSAKYLNMANKFQSFALENGAGSTPFFGGGSVTAKAAQLADPDRVTPQFNIGMFDDLLLGQTGNQTPGNPSGGNTIQGGAVEP